MMSENQPRVVVTGAAGRVGSALLPCLKAEGYHTVALARKAGPIDGADEVVGDWMNSPEALKVLQTADAVVHLSGEMFGPASNVVEANFKTTERIVQGVAVSKVKRIISLSYVGASLDSKNVYMRTNAQREQMLAETGIESVIFRCPAIINTPEQPGSLEQTYTSKNGKPVSIMGNGQQRHRPVYKGDVVNAIMAALKGGRAGVYDLTGPDEISLDEFVRMLNRGKDVKINHIPGFMGYILSAFLPGLTSTVVDIVLSDATGNPSKAVDEFGLKLTSLRRLWLA
jgi:uncharacterized protein YbjT (DUF2867 family)